MESLVVCKESNGDTYYNGSHPEKIIVTDELDYKNRKPLNAQIITEKAYLYNEPNINAKSKMYLIKGDTVALLQYYLDENNSWYLVSYKNPLKGVITRWIIDEEIKIID